MRIIIEKKHEGKTVFGLPTGNNRNRGTTSPIVEFTVVKVKRKYVDLKRKDSNYVYSYCPKSGSTQTAINNGYSNAGYQFFENLEDIERHLEHERKISEVKEYFRSFTTAVLSVEDVDTIHSIIYRT